MSQRIGRMLRLLSVCLLCAAACCVTAAAAQTRRATLDCTEFETSMISRTEGWYWDIKTQTLTLMGANIQPEREWIIEDFGWREDRTINGVVLPAGAKLVLLGENQISAVCYGIYSEGAITVEQKILLAPDDLAQIDSEVNGRLDIEGDNCAVVSGGVTFENGTMQAGSSWYTAHNTTAPGKSKFVRIEMPPMIAIDVTDCGAQLAEDGFYLVENGAVSMRYPSSGNYILTGASTWPSHAVTVMAGQSVALTLENLQLDLSENRWKCPLRIEADAQAEVICKGENVLCAGTTCAAIEVCEGATLTFSADSTGGLTATGGAGGAGIGGGADEACGTVVVEGGTIAATGLSGSAGIGQGSAGTGGRFVVSGGQLLLTGGYGAAALGGGAAASGGVVQVTGGTLTARGGTKAPGVGAGSNAENFVTTISGGTVAATGGKDASGIGAGAGATGCTTTISGGTVQSGGGYGAAGLSAGGTKTVVTTEEGVIPVQPEDGDTAAGSPNSMTVSGGSVSAAPGSGSGVAAVDQKVSGGSGVAQIAAVTEPAFAMPEDDSAQTYESYLATLPTEEDVRAENGGEEPGDEDQPDEPDQSDEPDQPDEPDEPDQPEDFTGLAMQTFDDLQAEAWYIPALDFVAGRELIDAIDGARTFAPDTSATRAVVVEALWRLAGRPEAEQQTPFTDVAADSPFAASIAWAQLTGVVTGDGDGSFRPSDNITREEMCAVLARFASWRGDKLQASLQGDFGDADDISAWAREAVYLCRGSGLVEGMEDGCFYPQQPVTRAELAQMLLNLDTIHTEQSEKTGQGVAE